MTYLNADLKAGKHPWERMWNEGHGEVWERITASAQARSRVLAQTLLRSCALKQIDWEIRKRRSSS